MKTDIEIAESAELRPIAEIAEKLSIPGDGLEFYGKYKAKVSVSTGTRTGKLILVTAINPTASGEGKTTVSIGLADAMKEIGANVCLALREPSLGPVFGIKGGATGGGRSQVAPMADINLHFTGDLHAITAANNLLCAMIDNHIKWGNKLGFERVVFKRCMDMNDRALRNVAVAYGGGTGGVQREDGFNITAASEVMAVLCLSSGLSDLKKRLSGIVVGYGASGKIIKAGELNAHEAMAVLLKDAIKPNLVQTLGGVPALIHGGPFANIAHGCNSVIATKTALSLADYCVTEAGFGADLGAEKFFDIKCRVSGLKPSAAVIVATVRALKLAGGAKKDRLTEENADALRAGLANLGKHIENMTTVFKIPAVVAINKFVSDTAEEIAAVREYCEGLGANAVEAAVWEYGGKGGVELANAVKKLADGNKKPGVEFSYELSAGTEEKITAVAKRVYGAAGVVFSEKAKSEIARIEAAGYKGLPVCIAKTQYSLSDDPQKAGRPEGFEITVRDVQLRAGAGFIVAVAGDIMLMPGLSEHPNAENMTISDEGTIKGLF